MTRPPNRDGDLPRRVALIGTITGCMIALLVAFEMSAAKRAPASVAQPVAVVPASAPIAAEADVFRSLLDDRASAGDAARRSSAHPRTLATFRALRAYPGAPPRVPHGLTSDELRMTRCPTCHERGGWVERFSAYAPVTPHPEFEACLQCHAIDAAVTGIPLPGRAPDAVCRQCHDPGNPASMSGAQEVDAASWPEPAPAAAGEPQPIPHDLQLRGNCVACHVGPGAVVEIRTTHPERSDCRQCHVVADPENDGLFRRTVAVTTDRGTP